MAKSNKEHVVGQRLCLHKLNKNSKKVWASLGPCQNKGITLVALMVTVIVLLIITTAGISTSLDRFEINNYRKMKNDLELLEDKVSDYYLKYEGLPVLRTSDSNIEVFNYKEYIKGLTNTNQEPATNANDNDIYYIIDLEALGNITLNYGKDFEKYKSNNVVQNVDTDIYIINEESHTIYYVKGIKMDNVTYHYIKRDEQISDDVPPTAPEIKVVSGIQIQGMYTNKVKLEIIPGKEKITEIEGTIYTVTKSISESESQLTAEETIKETKQFDLTDSGKYKIAAWTKDIKGNQSNTTEYELTINMIYYRKKNGENAQGYVLSENENTEVWDLFNNKLIVPEGFKITYDSKNVTEGTVIEDEIENQFVWIPVGTVYQNEEHTESKTIELGRYESFTIGSPKQEAENCENKIIINNEFTEDTESNHNTVAKNAIAEDIKDFCTKSNETGGYYIGRYEARTNPKRGEDNKNTLTDVTLKANDYVYNYVTQPNASKLCKEMYTNKTFTADLINSYAWDTAIIFFQEFGGKANYASESSVNSNFANKGTSGTDYSGTRDIVCNVYDMASNCQEWSTETSSYSSIPCTRRGGNWNSPLQMRTNYRGGLACDYSNEYLAFRPIIYLSK